MTGPIGGMEHLQSARLESPARIPAVDSSRTSDPAFKNLLMGSLQETANLQNAAQTTTAEHLAGGDVTQAEVFTAMKKADIALKMLLQIRNKTLQAYNEIKDLRM